MTNPTELNLEPLPLNLEPLSLNLEQLSQQILEISKCAAKEILHVYYDEAGIEVDTKEDESPVTKADLRANAVIVEMLEKLNPDIPILTEESTIEPYATRQHWGRYWIVDPLDGTKEFIRHSDEFTVNIALIENHKPVLGVVYVPVSGVAYLGAKGLGAKKISADSVVSIHCRRLCEKNKVVDVVASKHHLNDATEQFISAVEATLGEVACQSIGSSLKFCLLAEGLADVYPRFAPTSEWDTAAAQAVLEAAGGRVLKQDLSDLGYNEKENILNPNFFAVADSNADWATVVQQSV